MKRKDLGRKLRNVTLAMGVGGTGPMGIEVGGTELWGCVAKEL